MFHSFLKTPLTINGKTLIIESAELSSEIKLTPRYLFDNRISETELPTSMWAGLLKINYYLTGADYLKQYIYSNENNPITGNLAGMQFTQGYLSNYSINSEPNSPVLVSAQIPFYTQIIGNFTTSPPISNTGFVLVNSDTQLTNLSNYTTNILNNITRYSFDYSCDIKPNYNYFDTGIIPTQPDNVFFGERIINTEIISDNTVMSLPLSGEQYGINIKFSSPYNTGIYETIGCSGYIYSKNFQINTDKPHQHSIKITQHHVNKQGYIYSVQTGVNTLTINFNTGSFPLLSNDGSINYVNSIFIGDTPLTGYSINRTSNFDQIISPIPFNIVNNNLLINTSYGNYIWPNIINFSYPPITITSISSITGQIGTNITISGTNFTRISDVLFGNTEAQFQVSNPQTILATIPNNGISSPITVMSALRSISGSSSSFYYIPLVTYINPTTGQWKDSITISGTNFSGTTGVYFGGVPAYSYSLSNNNTIIAQSPDTGNSFASGYITVYSTGGIGQSASAYNPIVPIYSFTPTSGSPGTGITIYTKIDSGYLYSLSGGYKLSIAGEDCIFYPSGGNSTGILTGSLPFNDNNNYIYIYQPDGISTYPSTQQLTVVGYPTIYYTTPNTVNQYAYNNLLIVGNNLKYFYGEPYYIQITGGISGDYHTYGLSSFNYSQNGEAILASINITGGTGYYDVFVQNAIGGTFITGSLIVNSAINQATSFCSASYPATPSNLALSSAYKSQYPLFSIDNSTQTFAALLSTSSFLSTNAHWTGILSIYPVSTPYLNLSQIIINPNYTGVPEIFNLIPPPGSIGFPVIPINVSGPENTYISIPPTGFLIINSGNNPPYTGSLQIWSGYSLLFPSIVTGVTAINLCTSINKSNTLSIGNYNPITEVILY